MNNIISSREDNFLYFGKSLVHSIYFRDAFIQNYFNLQWWQFHQQINYRLLLNILWSWNTILISCQLFLFEQKIQETCDRKHPFKCISNTFEEEDTKILCNKSETRQATAAEEVILPHLHPLKSETEYMTEKGITEEFKEKCDKTTKVAKSRNGTEVREKLFSW